jgi:hypothetical protein
MPQHRCQEEWIPGLRLAAHPGMTTSAAICALIVANSFLETEVEELMKAVTDVC